jgi:type I restriction enzyme, S subunit
MTTFVSTRAPWRTETLGTLAEYVNGRAFKPEEWSTDGLPIIRIENLTDAGAPANHFEGEPDPKHRVDSGDLLVSWSATLDVFWWERGPAAVNQHIFKVSENPDKVRRDFLFFVLKSVIEQLRAQVHGSTMKHITKPKFVGLEVRIPSDRDEQAEIARELRQRMSAARRVRNALLKQSDAAQAVAGALIDRAVSGNLDQLGCLGDVLLRPAKSGWSPTCDDLPGGTPVLTLSSVTGFDFRADAIKLTSEPIDPDASYWAANGSLYMARSNTAELVGHVAIARDLVKPTIYPDLLMLLDIDLDRVDVEFAHLWLMSKTARTHIRTRARGSSDTMKKVNQTIINTIPFPTALSREDQQKIVRELRDKSDAARHAQRSIADAVQAVDALPSAIVREAFEIENLETVEDE